MYTYVQLMVFLLLWLGLYENVEKESEHVYAELGQNDLQRGPEPTYDNGFVPAPAQPALSSKETCSRLLNQMKEICFGSRKRKLVSAGVILVFLTVIIIIVIVTARDEDSTDQAGLQNGKRTGPVKDYLTYAP